MKSKKRAKANGATTKRITGQHKYDKMIREFEIVVKPVIAWLNIHCHPHCQVTITHTDAELTEGLLYTRIEEFIGS